jgi:putative membrane protein
MTRPLPSRLSLLGGLLMGAADAIPGVSGGTIALIIGLYERLINNLSVVVRSPTLIRSDSGRAELRAALRFLVPLGLGILVSYYAATRLLVGPTDAPGILRRPDTAPACYAFFFGLVLASIPEPWGRISLMTRHRWSWAAVGFVAAAVFVHLPHHGQAPPLWSLVLGGAGAIAIMLLPGVSGSLFLVIVGQYSTVAGAVHDRDLAVLAVFVAGIGLGVATFIPLLRRLLDRVHDQTMACLTGLMAGSLFALWPWKDNYEPKAGPMSNVAPTADALVLAGLSFLAGAAVVLFLSRLEQKVRSAT